jgi:excisionase family DNA binding protein
MMTRTMMGGATPTTNVVPGEPYITKRDVAQRVGKTVRTVDGWMKRGLLPYYKIGHTVAFKWSEVEGHLAENCRVVLRTRR